MLLLLAIGCASAAPVADSFDPTRSDPDAVAIADEMIAAAGGPRAWSEIRELGWLQTTVVDGEIAAIEELVWDRSGDRFRLVSLDRRGVVTVAVGRLDGSAGDIGKIMPSGCVIELMRREAERAVADSAARARRAAFLLALPFSMRARGVRLARLEPRPAPGVIADDGAPVRYDVIRVSFESDPDILDLVVDRRTRRAVLVEQPGETGVRGTRLERPATAGRVELATARIDVGSTKGAAPVTVAIPPHLRGRVDLGHLRAPARGSAVFVSQLAAYADVEANQFAPGSIP